MTLAEEMATSEFFIALRNAISRGIRIKTIRIKETARMKKELPAGTRITFLGIPVTVTE